HLTPFGINELDIGLDTRVAHGGGHHRAPRREDWEERCRVQVGVEIRTGLVHDGPAAVHEVDGHDVVDAQCLVQHQALAVDSDRQAGAGTVGGHRRPAVHVTDVLSDNLAEGCRGGHV